MMMTNMANRNVILEQFNLTETADEYRFSNQGDMCVVDGMDDAKEMSMTDVSITDLN